MKCPEVSNKNFDTMRKVLGTKVAYNTFNANNGNTLDRAPNGADSMLFRQLNSIVKSEPLALMLKAQMMTKSFQKKHEWLKDVPNSIPTELYSKPIKNQREAELQQIETQSQINNHLNNESAVIDIMDRLANKIDSMDINEFYTEYRKSPDKAAKMLAKKSSLHTFTYDASANYSGRSFLDTDINMPIIEINLAKMNSETAIHELLGHPLIRSIKRTNPKLYSNLKKELRKGKGLETLNKIKAQYGPRLDKAVSKYDLEEEAMVHLLTDYVNGNIDKVKDRGLFSVLRELLIAMKKAVRDLFKKKELDIALLPDNLTVGDIANVITFSKGTIKFPNNNLLTQEEVNNKDKRIEKAKKIKDQLLNKPYRDPMYLYAFEPSLSHDESIMNALDKAKTMEANGDNMRDIKRITGWEKLAYKNRWMFEMVDYQLDIDKFDFNKEYSLNNLIQSDASKYYTKLFSNYTVKFSDKINFRNASMDPIYEVIEIGTKGLESYKMLSNSKEINNLFNETLYHEIQHIITLEEDLPPGSNFEIAAVSVLNRYNIKAKGDVMSLSEAIKAYDNSLTTIEINGKFYNVSKENIGYFASNIPFNSKSDASNHAVNVIKNANNVLAGSARRVNSEIVQSYFDNFGEILSRSAGDRAKKNLNSEERRNHLMTDGVTYQNILYGENAIWLHEGNDNNGEPILKHYSTTHNSADDYVSTEKVYNLTLFKETQNNLGNITVPGFSNNIPVDGQVVSSNSLKAKGVDINRKKIGKAAQSKSGGILVKNDNMVPLIQKNRYDESNGSVVNSVPMMQNGNYSIPLNGVTSGVRDFKNQKTLSAQRNENLFGDTDGSKDLADKIMNANRRRLGNIVLKSLKQMFPDINFIEETNASTIAKTSRKDIDGWVDNNGNIHVNLEHFNPNTSIHELGHILEPLLKRKHPQLYSNIRKEMENGVNSKKGIYYALYKTAQENYDHINTHDSIMSEVFAEGLASLTMDNLERILSANPTLFENKDMEISNVRNDFSPANEAATYIFDEIIPGSKISTMEGLAHMLASNIANGGTRIEFTKEDKVFLKDYFVSIGAQYQIENNAEQMSKVEINSSKGVVDYFRGDNFDKPDPKKIASTIASNVRNSAEKGKPLKFHDSMKNQTHEFSRTITHEELTNQIFDIYVNPLIKFRAKIEDDLISNYVPNQLEQPALEDLLGDSTSQHVINKLKLTMGLDEPVDSIMRYSDLKNHPDSRIKKLYDKSLEGFNPIIVVHGIDDKSGDVSLSIVSMQPTKIREQERIIGEQNIFSTIMTDNDYRNKSPLKATYISKMRNTEADLRMLSITLIASHFRNVLGKNFKLNKMGVTHVTPSSFSARMVINIEAQMENIGMLNSFTSFMERLEDNKLKEAIKYGQEVSYENTVSYMGLLKSHLLNIADDLGGDEYFGYSANDLIEKLNAKDPEARLIVLDSMRAATLEHLGDRDATSDAVYMMIIKASRELRTGRSVTYNDMKDMSELAKSFKSMYHMSNDYVQDVITAVQEATFKITDKAIKDIRKLAGTTGKPGLARRIKNRIMKANVKTGATAFVGDVGSELYEHLYKFEVVKLVDNQGEFIENEDGSFKTAKVKTPELHWDKNDPNTKKAMDDGIITKEDLEFNNMMLDILEERYRDMIKHNYQKKLHVSKVKNTEMNQEELDREYKSFFPRRGMIPTIEISTSELLLSGKFKESFKKGYSQLSMSEALFEDVANFDDAKNKQLTEMHGFFMEQLTEEKRLGQAGLTYASNGELALFDQERNTKVSTDVWKSFNYLNQSLLRKVEYEKNVMPIAQDTIALLRQIGEDKESNNIQLVKEFIDRNAHRKNKDDKNSLDLGKFKFDAPPAIRGVKKAWNMAMLPGRVALGVLSTVFNTSAIIIDSLAGIVTESNGSLPPIKYFIKAAKESFTPNGAKKMRSLALDNHIWGRSERDLLTDPFINVSDHSIFNSMFGNIFNWASDAWARSLVMSAVMMQDGSWEAHEYNEQSGEIEYDETKDLRWYNKDGTKKTDEVTLELYKGIKLDVQKTLGLDTPPDKLPTGYGMTDALYMKQLADTRIIGAFSDDVSAMITNRWFGNLFMQYRNYATVRAFNMGIFGNKIKTSVGQRIVPVKLKDGTWVSKREIMDLEGAMQSYGKLFSEMESISVSGLSESYNKLNDVQKTNIARTILKLGFFLLTLSLFALDDGEDDDDILTAASKTIAYKWSADLIFMNSLLDIFENPFPSFTATEEMVKEGEFHKILPYYKAVSNTAEALSDDND